MYIDHVYNQAYHVSFNGLLRQELKQTNSPQVVVAQFNEFNNHVDDSHYENTPIQIY